MARKPSARGSKKSRKPKKGNKMKGKKAVAKKAKSGTAKKPSARPKPRAVQTKSRTVSKAPARGKAPVSAPARAAKGGKPVPAGKSKMGKRPGERSDDRTVQSTMEFDAEPAMTSFSTGAMPAPPPRRRSAKPGSPDWPGESLTVGMMAPEFSLPSTSGRKITLSEFRGKRVVLYFYPKDDTPGCTMEACAFRDHMPRFELKDAVVLGVSLDDELSHQRFAQKYNLPFALLSDVDAAVSRQYGTYKEKSLYGRSYWGIERTTFVIDREGRVENVFRRVKVEGHAEEVMATLAL